MSTPLFMKEAILYEKLEDSKVKCNVCSHRCMVLDKGRGFCGVRENLLGKMYSLVYGKIVSQNIDPIEKKPLFHFFPGSLAYSIATVGCNMRCMHCQNFSISQVSKYEKEMPGQEILPEKIIEQAIGSGCQSIAYTYTEPTIYLEYALDTMKLAKEKGLKNIWVSNGYMTEETLNLIKPYLDAINVDLKFFNDSTYQKICSVKLDPVLNSLKWLYKNKIWLEITTLIIPGLNDDEKQLSAIARFIKEELSASVPWHVSAFYPTYKLTDVSPTPCQTIKKAYDIGKKAGLKYVYAGNVDEEGMENTYCPNCGEKAIGRKGYEIFRYDKYGKCADCGEKIDIVLKIDS